MSDCPPFAACSIRRDLLVDPYEAEMHDGPQWIFGIRQEGIDVLRVVLDRAESVLEREAGVR